PYNPIFDLRYATTNNITGRVLSENYVPMLKEPAAYATEEAARRFALEGLRLVIWAAYHPEELHEQLRAVNDNDDYVRKDSNHPKGLAVDVTLAIADGRYLDMGTDFDDFSGASHINSKEIDKKQHENRRRLSNTMRDVGFTLWPPEWWHFDYRGNPS